jgi:glycosyltransferase involved in cell wall biosynthesis
MRRLIFATQKLDPNDVMLAATIPKVRALAARVDELVVLCDSAVPEAVPANVRIHEFQAGTQAHRGARFARALASELRPRPIGFVAHMVPLYALIAAPLLRPLGIPLVLWYTQWKANAAVRAAEKVCTTIVSVDERSFPVASKKVRGIGHGIDVTEFSCSEAPAVGQLRVLVLGRYSPAKGLETILRGAALAGAHVEAHGSDATVEEYKRELERTFPDADLGGPVVRSRIPDLFAHSHVLVNNMQPGAADKVVYEAAASCLPVLASSPLFEDLLPAELRFDRDDPEDLAARLRALDRRRRPELRRLVEANHSVDHWADALLATVERR